MTSEAKAIFEQTGSLILGKKECAKIIRRSVSFINKEMKKNTQRIPNYTKDNSVINGGIEFNVQDVADFLVNRRKQNQRASQ